MFNGKTHYKWPFSIAMLVHQRVPGIVSINQFHFSCSSISLSYLAHSSRCYSGTISTGLIEDVEVWIDLTNEKIKI